MTTTPARAPDAGASPARPSFVAAYLERIGVAPPPGGGGPDDPAAPELVRRMVAAHLASIPFENLDPFTGAEPPTGADQVAAKLVGSRRGGWCLEQNRLVHDVLDALGHRVTPLLGRVRLGLDDDAPATLRTHRLTLLRTAEGSVIVDVGVGGPAPYTPLRLVTGTVQRTPHADYRYRRAADGTWLLQRRGDGAWRSLYTFDLTPAPAIDHEMGSWYLTHHPGSEFRHGLTAALATGDRRLSLDGRRFTVRHTDGRTERREQESPADVRRVLEEEFGIDTSRVTGLERRIRETHFG